MTHEARILTYTGRYVDLLDPSPEQIHIDDIAASLSKLNRFTGHTPRPYTVAEHLLLGVEQTTPAARFRWLLHDFTEAYLGDVAGPLKRLPGMAPYRSLEAAWEVAIGKRFLACGGLSFTKADTAIRKEVATVDQRMLLTEMRDLMGRKPVSTDTLKPFALRIGPVAPDPELLRERFLTMFYALAARTEGAIR